MKQLRVILLRGKAWNHMLNQLRSVSFKVSNK